MDFNKNDQKDVNESHNSRVDLHYLEEKLMISPLKKLMISFFELNIFKYFLRSTSTKIVRKSLLEVGCGAGYGIEQIYKSFKPKEYYAFDISQKMVSLSKAKAEKHEIPVQLFLGDVENIELSSNKFDVVFVFTVLHHVVGWQDALKEINRVLKPKGLLMINEINERSLNWFERYLKVYHPKKARFTWTMFRHGLTNAGFQIQKEFLFLRDFGFFLCTKRK